MKKKLLPVIGSLFWFGLAVSCLDEDVKSVAETESVTEIAEYTHALPLADSIYVPSDAEMSTAVQLCPAGEHSTEPTYSVYRVFGNDFAGKGEKHSVTKQRELSALVSELEKLSLSEQPEPREEYAGGLVVKHNMVQSSIPVCVLASPETPFSEVFRILQASCHAGTVDYWFAVRKRSVTDVKSEDSSGVLRFAFVPVASGSSSYELKPLVIYIDEDNYVLLIDPLGSKIKLSLVELGELLTEINARDENGPAKPIVLESHPNAQYQRFIDVVAVLNQQKRFVPVVGVEMQLADGSRGMGYAERKKPDKKTIRKQPSEENAIQEEVSASTTVTPVITSRAPNAVQMPMAPAIADMSDGLSADVGLSDGIGAGDLGDGMGGGGDGLGSTEGGGSTLEGTFYDLKLKKSGAPSGVGPSNQKQVVEVLAKFFASWNEQELNKYYKSDTKLYASSWYLPVASAKYGPLAFDVGDPKKKEETWECKPSAWIAVYRGKVIAPKTGTFRFIGTGDDFFAVRFDRKTVLAAGYRIASYYDKKSPDDCFIYHGDAQIRAQRLEKFLKAHEGFEMIKGVKGCEIWDNELGGLVAGTPFKVKEGEAYDIEIAISEIPGGKFGFVLFIEDITDGKNSKAKQYDLFRTCDTNPDIDKIMRALKEAKCDVGTTQIPFNEDSWVWEVVPED